MNIHRLPFSGRNNEYDSEDGFLSSMMAASTCRGAASKGMYTFIKHFAVNDQENHRGDGSDSAGNVQYGLCTWATEQTIREIYLLPFQMCIENNTVTLNYVEEDRNGGYVNTSRDYPAVTALMTAFNRLGYTWTGGSYNLLTSVLREEWGFDGFVITDAAHTRPFMDAYQMLEASGDAKLTNADKSTVPFTFDKDDPAHFHYGRQAMHNILYTVANSKVMNGLMPGSEFVTPMTMVEKILTGINIASVVIILALAYSVFRGFKPTRKTAAKAEEQRTEEITIKAKDRSAEYPRPGLFSSDGWMPSVTVLCFNFQRRVSPLISSLKVRPKNSAALRHRSIRSRKISK